MLGTTHLTNMMPHGGGGQGCRRPNGPNGKDRGGMVETKCETTATTYNAEVSKIRANESNTRVGETRANRANTVEEEVGLLSFEAAHN